MRTVWKYELADHCLQTLMLPSGASILTVGCQHGNVCLWIECDTDAPIESRDIEIFGTGHPIGTGMGAERRYISTFQMNGGDLVFHAYERINYRKGLNATGPLSRN